ncbi:hypothetical protein BDW22DRAFT_1356038 [Trametopsis cervina]|nr:hypothetical protein BDW22DRAFT_1356038 [Trametopsis cervina]
MSNTSPKTQLESSQPIPPTQGNGLQDDIALLASLLAAEPNSDEIDETHISELLRRLDAANGVASGVETRLDDILSNLDGLLGKLEEEAGGATITEKKEEGATDAKEGEK